MSIIPQTVDFQSVQVGDKVYNYHHFCDPWEKVTEIKRAGSLVTLKIGLSSNLMYDTRTCIAGHPLEAISVKRAEVDHG